MNYIGTGQDAALATWTILGSFLAILFEIAQEKVKSAPGPVNRAPKKSSNAFRKFSSR